MSTQTTPIAVQEAPTLFVIFGMTGDLARKKLIPALLDLYSKGLMPATFKILGFSRRAFSDEAFRAFVTEALLLKKHTHPDATVKDFLSHIEYIQGTFDSDESYQSLKMRLDAEDRVFVQCSNKLFYLAVPPSLYEGILTHIADADLAKECSPHTDGMITCTGWSRILIEKPFGRDTDTARTLDMMLGKLFREDQIFRIDHYLAKEALQNILAFRFSNGLFMPVWNKEHIEQVHIKLFESNDVSGRGAFYNDIGALRDVGQNHLLQMLALIAMENPHVFDAESIRIARAHVLDALIPLDKKGSIVHGQYKGFTEEECIDTNSCTETYFKMHTFLSLKEWEGVPFILESGKALPESKTEISIHFKAPEYPYKITQGVECSNKLTFTIQPDERIEVVFWTKTPGLNDEVEQQPLSFSYADTDGPSFLSDAYERVLFDCIRGDQTLFTSTKEVCAAWKYITPLFDYLDNKKIHIYEKGTLPDITE